MPQTSFGFEALLSIVCVCVFLLFIQKYFPPVSQKYFAEVNIVTFVCLLSLELC